MRLNDVCGYVIGTALMLLFLALVASFLKIIWELVWKKW